MPEKNNEEKIISETKILIEKGFFELTSGQVIINKNNGLIQDMRFIIIPYKRRKGVNNFPLDKSVEKKL